MGGSLAAAARAQPAEFGLRFLEFGGEQRVGLAVGWDVPFERVRPVREFPSYRGQRSFSGSWWSSTMSDLVGFESWLERDQVMMLDFSPQVRAFSSQPFWLTWRVGSRIRRHAPDYFARLADGTGVVIDVRADDQIGPEDAEAFAATNAACESVGWIYRRVGAVAPVLAANVRWLSGYRHPRCLNRCHEAGLRGVFERPTPLLAAVRSVGDPVAVLPTLFHLLWAGVLVVDLESQVLDASRPVVLGGAG